MPRSVWAALLVAAAALLISAWPSNALPLVPIPQNSSMLWGTYRPNLYFAMSTRTPAPIVAGLMWFTPSRGVPDTHRRLRHACEQGQVGRYGWKVHDGATFGTHELIDGGATLTTTFLKHPGGDKGGDWTMRVKGDGPAGSSISLFFYVRNEEDTLQASGLSVPKKKGLDKLRIEGSHSALGQFSLYAKEGSVSSPQPEMESKYKARLADLGKPHYVTAWLKQKDSWRVKELVEQMLEEDFRQRLAPVWNDYVTDMRQRMTEQRGPPGEPPFLVATLSSKPMDSAANVVIVQRTLNFPFEIDFNFVSHTAHPGASAEALQEALARVGAALSTEITQRTSAFEQRFQERYHPEQNPQLSTAEKDLARAALSSLVGSIGYFHGSWVKRIDENTTETQTAASLLTGVPSRSFFPRGFLWDEGFHEILVSRWDPSISVDVISHWLNLMGPDGWIAREQILGDEARSRVPSEFVVQNPLHANPPTLVLAIGNLLHSLSYTTQEGSIVPPLDASNVAPAKDDGHAKILTFAANAMPRLEKWFAWLQSTQRGAAPASFRWRGRTANHTLSSGIDDYPRAPTPTDEEIHVDLQCWMALFAKLLSHIAQRLNIPDKAKVYQDLYQLYVGRLDALFWSDAFNQYGDAIFHDGAASPLPHSGYISLFPFLFGFIPPTSPKVLAVIQMIRNPEELGSPYGLRSIAKSDPYFGTGENYWRGPIWLNINYLTLAALHDIYMREGAYQKEARAAYVELRQRLVSNVVKVWQETGFVYEQYNPVDGKGKGCYPFTGWSALIAEIILERYVRIG